LNDEGDLHDEGDEDGAGHAHKKIPTWQDAVGTLIDANIAARERQPDRGGRGSRRGGGRR
jgi:hypothetical protein